MNALRNASLFLAGHAVVAGCTTLGSGGNHPEAAPWRHRPNYAMAVTYQRPLRAASRQMGEPYERGQPTIDARHRRVFVGSSDRGLYALRAEDGDTLWRFETLGPVQCEPLYDSATDRVYFGSNDGAMYKVRANDGHLLWRFSSRAEINRRPVLSPDGRTLYFINANDTVVAVDAETGKLIWSQHRVPALGMEIAGYAGLLLADGRVHTAFSDGVVTAYDAATGKEVWQPVDLAAAAEQVLGEVPQYLDADTTPVLAKVGGVTALIVGGYAGGIFALDTETGNQLWSNPAVLGVTDVSLWEQPAHTSLADDGQELLWPSRSVVVVSTGTTGLWALDTATGREVWRRALPSGGTNRPIPVAGALMVTTTREGIFLLSPIDGGVIDGIRTEVGFSMPVAAHGDRAFVLSNSGTLLGLSVETPR